MGSQAMSSVIMLVALFAIMYFMMIRPENKRKKKAQEMRDNLKKGDTITTIGGIIGKVVAVNNDTFVIESSEQPEKKSKKDEVPEEPVDELPAETEDQ